MRGGNPTRVPPSSDDGQGGDRCSPPGRIAIHRRNAAKASDPICWRTSRGNQVGYDEEQPGLIAVLSKALMTDTQDARPSLLARLGLRTKQQRAWAMYDWANSAMVTIIVTAVFPIFYASHASHGVDPSVATLRYSMATTIGLIIIAVLAPLLGAIADNIPVKKKLLGTFLGLGVAAVAAMFFISRGDWLLASVLFVLANIGANGSFVFYDALLPHVAKRDEIDRVSTAGYALGYVGGGLLLLLCLAMILKPDLLGVPSEGATPEQASLPARVSFVLVALWWASFSIPLFRHVPEPPVCVIAKVAGPGPIRSAFLQLRRTAKNLREYKHAFLMLIAFLIYNDGIGTIIRMATIYGEEIGIGRTALIGTIVIVQFVGIPFSFAFGALAGRIGAKTAIFLGLAVYCAISVLGYFMTTAAHFMLLGLLVGIVQGGTQALSRSLFGSMIPSHLSGEYFGLFAVFEKFAGILGPALFGVTIALSGSSRNAILSVISFFALGALLLWFVDPEEGRRTALAAEKRVASEPSTT